MQMDYTDILQRMFERLNSDGDGNPVAMPHDSRPSSPAYNVMAPVAMAQADVAGLVEILRAQVNVYTATGTNLDDIGRDYNFPRFVATQAIRRGVTENAQGEVADFPLGSRFQARDGSFAPLIFILESSQGGEVLFRSEAYGAVGNTYYGELSPASPINGIGRAAIVDSMGAYIPGQDEETDEQYRRRFLRFLRHKAFGGNVAQYSQEVQTIDGVGDLMVFPVWRGGGTAKVSIVDANNEPVSRDFVGVVSEKINTTLAPVGHRVTVATPNWLDIDINIPVTLAFGVTIGQVEARFNEILQEYFAEVRQGVLDEWERTYAANEGIANAYVDVKGRFNALFERYDDPEIFDLATHFPAECAKQTHTFYTSIHPQIIGVRLLNTRLVTAVDFENITINGVSSPSGMKFEQTEEVQFIPRLASFNIDVEG